MYLSKEYLPVNKNTGFSMDGYFVWCGSMMKEGDTYYLFAARWPEEKTFPNGYMTDSEIVLAKTDDLAKPFTFEKVVIAKRDGDYWDAGMAHNPFVVKIGAKYVMYYIGTVSGSAEKRAIGYAVADRLDGEWTRADKPIALPPNANNPSALVEADGSILLYFRDGELKVCRLRAPKALTAHTRCSNMTSSPKDASRICMLLKITEGMKCLPRMTAARIPVIRRQACISFRTTASIGCRQKRKLPTVLT